MQIVEARAIADGIVRYLTTDDPGVGHNGVRRTGRILTTGGRYACVDPPLDLSTSHTSRYSTTEWAEVVAAANRRGETVADFQKASVRILAFLFGLSGKDPPRLAAHRQPANVGPHGATSSWSPDERAMLVRFASAFGLPTEQTQKIIAVGVAYILSLS